MFIDRNSFSGEQCGTLASFYIKTCYFYFAASKFFSALAADGAINEEMLSESELDRIYGPLRQQVNESLQKQDSVMAQVQVKLIYIKCRMM